jgi:glc operon protein GlcG
MLAIAGANSLATRTSAGGGTTNQVSYFEKSTVEQAFSKGAELLDGSEGRNYRVDASRREKPGEAEIHVKDTDVIYVTLGSATFITGGEVVNAQTVAPDELRGPSIRNGERRQIAKGDVLIVPASTPHQFVEVTNPFLYYVVKVR